jgi:hypothetical protein
MKPNDIFSIRDFFNYYFAGLLWVLDFLVIFLLLSQVEGWKVNLSDINAFLDSTNVAVTAVAIILIPYLVGFVFNPIGDFIMAKVRSRYNEALHWVTDSTHKWACQGLKNWENEAIQVKMKELFKLQDKNYDELFFTIRAYIEENSLGAASLASRALDLTNMAESIVIPFPLFFILISIYCGVVLKSFWAIFWIFIAALIFILLLDRYLKLRSYWAKHVYRAFLVTIAKKSK